MSIASNCRCVRSGWVTRAGRWDVDVLGRRVLEDLVDHAGAVEAGDHGHPPAHRRRLEPLGLMHPPDVQLEVRTPRSEGIEGALLTPVEVGAQIGIGVNASLARETGEVAGQGDTQSVGGRDENR